MQNILHFPFCSVSGPMLGISALIVFLASFMIKREKWKQRAIEDSQVRTESRNNNVRYNPDVVKTGSLVVCSVFAVVLLGFNILVGRQSKHSNNLIRVHLLVSELAHPIIAMFIGPGMLYLNNSSMREFVLKK